MGYYAPPNCRMRTLANLYCGSAVLLLCAGVVHVSDRPRVASGGRPTTTWNATLPTIL